MANLLRSKCDVIINGGGIVGFTLLNLLLKSPHLNRTKTLLIEQSKRLSTFKQPLREKAYQIDSGTQEKVGKLFSNQVSSITLTSKRAYNKYTKSAKERIDDLINKSDKKVFVFMKGVPEQPACGYSNAVVQILNAYEVDYDSFNVLEDDEIRQEIKVYSNWPTIPQVYVDKNFVGGCDILIQMHQNDELEKLFEITRTST